VVICELLTFVFSSLNTTKPEIQLSPTKEQKISFELKFTDGKNNCRMKKGVDFLARDMNTKKEIQKVQTEAL